jgi:ribonuclease HI
MNELYVDGGVIRKNPSAIGGTWAARLVEDGRVLWGTGGVITPKEAQMPEITNNLTEMLALVRGLSLLPDDWQGTVYSDSEITLGRAFMGWKWKNIPLWLHHEYQAQVKRLKYWPVIRYVRLDGHPTREHLATGKGKRGGPVSVHNAWCDEACGHAAAVFMGREVPTL